MTRELWLCMRPCYVSVMWASALYLREKYLRGNIKNRSATNSLTTEFSLSACGSHCSLSVSVLENEQNRVKSSLLISGIYNKGFTANLGPLKKQERIECVQVHRRGRDCVKTLLLPLSFDLFQGLCLSVSHFVICRLCATVSVCLTVCLSVCLFVHLSACLSV